MNKLNVSPKDLKKFKEDFTSGEIEAEVVLNTCFDLFRQDEDNLLKELKRKKLSEDEINIMLNFRKVFSNNNGVIREFAFFNPMVGEYLKDKYGNPDFKFTGNRTYENYLVEYKELTFILSEKPEYHSNAKIKAYKPLLVVEFMKDFVEDLMSYVMSNQDKYATKYVFDLIKKGIKNGEITSDYKIVYTEAVKEEKKSNIKNGM